MTFALLAIAGMALCALCVIATGVCLSLWPEWTANQWWYPMNKQRLERLGYQPHVTTPTILRANGIFMLVLISLLALSLLPGDAGALARLGYFGVWGLGVAFVVVRTVAWTFLPSSVLKANPWLTAGTAGWKYRSPFLRFLAGAAIILMAALGLIIMLSLWFGSPP